MNIVFVHGTHFADQYQVMWRCNNIAKAIERTGLHHAVTLEIPAFVSKNENCVRVCQDADLIVIHRYDIGIVLQSALYWKAQKKKIVLDLDEAVDLIPPEMEQYRFWFEGEVQAQQDIPENVEKRIHPAPIQQITWAMSLMDAVTSSTRRLAGDWEKHGRIRVIQDYLSFDRYLTVKSHQEDEVWIGMGGSAISSQSYENSGLISALEEVCRLCPQVHLWLGNTPVDLITRINIPPNQKVTYSWIPPEDWPSHLSNLDIGLALAFTEYDLRFSRNRVLEYLACKIPWIGSNHLPHSDLKDYGMLVDNSKESWYQGLMMMVNSLPEYRAKAAGNAYLFALSQDIDENIGNILDVYENILREK